VAGDINVPTSETVDSVDDVSCQQSSGVLQYIPTTIKTENSDLCLADQQFEHDVTLSIKVENV